MLWKALVAVAWLNFSPVSFLFELVCLGRAQKLTVMKSVACETCCLLLLHFYRSLGDSLPTAGKWKEDFSPKDEFCF